VKISQKAEAANIRPGTCRSTNSTVRCDHTFPNTFNITAVTFADISASDSSNTSSIYAEQSKQYANTTIINQTLVHQLSETVSALLITSVVLNFFFLPLPFFVDTSNPRSRPAQILFIFVLLDCCAQSAAVGMVYLIIRNEVGGAYDVSLGINTHWPSKFELGFWFLVGVAASRLLYLVLSALTSPLEDREPNQQTQDRAEAYRRQQGRASRIKKPNSLRDADNVDKVFYANLTSKIASTIRRLRTAVETYQYQDIIDEGCKRLLSEVRDDEKLAFLMSSHFNRHSAALFLGTNSMVAESPPVLPLWESCPYRGSRIAPEFFSRGVYLIVLSECCHGGGSQISISEYKYVGSGRSARGVMGRVKQHIDPQYRTSNQLLYRVWDGTLRVPCVTIYLLAEWDPLPNGMNRENAQDFDDILLAEAIWQVVLQTSAQNNMSDFTQFLRQQDPGNLDLISNVWGGCNVNSALEKPWRDRNTWRR